MNPLGLILLIVVHISFASSLHDARNLGENIQGGRVVRCEDGRLKSERLLLVNILNRHGDRAPTNLPKYDKHSNQAAFFWPRGLGEMTSTGLKRMYNLGTALRRHYNERNLLNYDTDSILALTSNVSRCVESQEATLRGFYEMASTLDRGLDVARKLRDNKTETIPSGRGSSSVWSDVKLDRDLIKSLDYTYYAISKYAKNHPSSLQSNMMNDAQVRALEGIESLRKLLTSRYKQQFALNLTSIWASIQIELYIDRTNETIQYMDHFADWIESQVKSDGKETVNMFDLFEEVVLLSFLGMADKNSDYLVISPIINSLIESQSVALGRRPHNERSKKYLGKNIIFYSTHDSIMTMMLHDLGIISIDGSTFADQLLKAKRDGLSNVDRLLKGLKMCNFGLSLKFELWSIGQSSEATDDCNQFDANAKIDGEEVAVVRLAIYNEPDHDKPIEWQSIPLGSLCRSRYEKLFNDNNYEQYYPQSDSSLPAIDHNNDCPFELFKKISSPWFLNETLYDLIYNDQL